MAKKSARKISGVKKVSSKSPNKKIKFSLKAWLLGGLVLLIALAYSYSNSQPKSYKVIELSGKAEDYIKPAPVDINLINNTVKGPFSDTPEANAIAAAAQAKKIAKEAGKSDEQANQAAKIAANQAVKQTYQANAAAGVMTSADAQKALDVKVKNADGTEKTEAEKAAEYATNYVQNNINIVPKTDETTGTTSYSIQIQPNYGSQVNTEGQCETSNGGAVYAGSTVIGSSDRVYRCTSTGWQATDTYCVASKMDIKDCPVSVKPSYALPTGKANCYSGSVIIGQDQVVDTKDGKRVCDNGALIQPKKINGQIVTPDEYEEILKDQQNKCVNNGGSWTQTGSTTGEYYCGKGNSKTCSAIGKVFSETTQGCVEPGSAGDKSAGDKADSKKTTPYSKAGCDKARDINKEDCIQSADNPLLWVIVPKGTKPSVNTGVPAKVSSEVNSNKISNSYTGKECEDAARSNPGYSCEPIVGGNYYKLTPVSEIPARQYDPNAVSGFGDSQSSNSSSNNAQFDNTFTNFTTWSLCVNDSGKTKYEACVKTPDGKYSQVPISNPNVKCNFFICAWKKENGITTPISGKLPPGAECDLAGFNDDACQSNLCLKMTKPGESVAKFYCIPENTYKYDIRKPDGTLLYKNGTVCRSGSDCASGFCADIAFSWSNIDPQNRCIDNPFISSTSLLNTQPLVTNSQSAPDKKKVDEEVVSPSDCESGKAAFIKYQSEKNFRCKPASFCPEQDIAKQVTCYENGDPICTSGQPWEPGVDCIWYHNSNSNQLNAVGTLNDSTNPNSQTLGPVLPPGYIVQMQNASNIASYNLNVNNINTTGGTTNAEVGCAPTTVINTLRYLESIGEIPALNDSNKALLQELITRSNFYISCTPEYGCSSGVEAMLKVLENKYGIQGAYSSMDQNKITSASDIEKMNGVFLYQGDVYDPAKKTNKPDGTFGHNSMFICKDGKCINIDSYTGDGVPRECVSTNETTLLCGTTEYELSTEPRDNGGQSAAYQLPIDLPSN